MGPGPIRHESASGSDGSHYTILYIKWAPNSTDYRGGGGGVGTRRLGYTQWRTRRAYTTVIPLPFTIGHQRQFWFSGVIITQAETLEPFFIFWSFHCFLYQPLIVHKCVSHIRRFFIQDLISGSAVISISIVRLEFKSWKMFLLIEIASRSVASLLLRTPTSVSEREPARKSTTDDLTCTDMHVSSDQHTVFVRRYLYWVSPCLRQAFDVLHSHKAKWKMRY
jgi:hypothetical protein